MTNTDPGIIAIQSNHSADRTLTNLEELLRAKGLKIFAVIDHSGEAETAGMSMPNTKLVVFGDPKAGTPLMLASPGAAIDLPLKILIAEDNMGQVWISWSSPLWLQARHGFPIDLTANIAGVEALARSAGK